MKSLYSVHLWLHVALPDCGKTLKTTIFMSNPLPALYMYSWLVKPASLWCAHVNQMSLFGFCLKLARFASEALPLASKPLNQLISPKFVSAYVPSFRTYKTEDRLRLRCRDCFFERRDNRLYVECKTHARHRQAQLLREPITPWRFRRKIWKQVKWYWDFTLNLCTLSGRYQYTFSLTW